MDAHLPAYHMAGFPVWGAYNRMRESVAALANAYKILNVFDNLDPALIAAHVIARPHGDLVDLLPK